MPGFGEQRRMLEAWAALPVRERVPAGGAAALTFDDGPDPAGTPAVLDALEAAGARATFFCVGEQVRGAIGLARQVAARGHEIALHGYAHERHELLSPQRIRDDIARGLGALEAATARRPRRYRPPYGLLAEATRAACADLGLEPVGWSAWGLDWEDVPAARIAELAGRDLDDGAIVLLHDSARYAPRASAAATAAAVGPLAALAAERGLRLDSMEAILAGGGP